MVSTVKQSSSWISSKNIVLSTLPILYWQREIVGNICIAKSAQFAGFLATLITKSAQAFVSQLTEGKSSQELMASFTGRVEEASQELLKVLPKLSKQFSDATNEGAEQLQFSKAANRLGDELYKSLEGILGRSFDGISDMTGRFMQGMTLNTVPYMAGALITLAAAPLGMHYLYKRAVHDIGRPTLATEVGLVGFAKIQDLVVRLLGTSLRAVKSGTLWGMASLATTFTGLVGEGVVCYASGGKTHACLTGLSGYNYSTHRHQKDDVMIWSFPVGFAFGALSSLGSETWQLIKNKRQAYHPDPMFTEDLTKQIKEISKTSYNLHKNGGFFQNVLLYGPGGTGKTMVADAIIKGIAKSGAKMNWIKMTGASLAQYIKRGEHVTEVNKLFDYMKNSSAPTILFIDEIEALGMDRDKLDKSELFEIIDTFLGQTGSPTKQFMIIGATNKKELLDPAILSRMDYKLHIHPPALEERIQILSQEANHFFSKQERETLLNPSVIKQLAQKTAGLTGRSLCKMINAIHAKKMASDNKMLTPKMITETQTKFVGQERKDLSFIRRTFLALRFKDY